MASMVLTCTSRKITAVVDGLENIQTYDRTFTFDLSNGSQIVRTVQRASGIRSVYAEFTNLTPGTGYSVNCAATRSDTGHPLAGWFLTIVTDTEGPACTLTAESPDESSIKVTLNIDRPSNVARTFTFTSKNQGGTVLQTIERIVSAGSRAPITLIFSEGLEPLTTYTISAVSTSESYTVQATTQDRPEVLPPLATLKAVTHSSSDVTAILTDISPYNKYRLYTFTISRNDSILSSTNRVVPSSEESGFPANDILVSFTGLDPSTTYVINCKCEELSENYTVSVNTLDSSSDPSPSYITDVTVINKNYETLEQSRKSNPYSKVVIYTGLKNEDDEDITYVAGNDSGLTLEINNPLGSQAIANGILNAISGYRIQPFDITNALLDPAAELGDGIVAGNVYSEILSLNQDYGLILTSDVNAPKTDEDEDEFSYTPQSEKSFARTISELKTQLKIQNNLIEGRISYGSAESLIKQTVDEISLSVTNGEDSSTLTLKAGETTLSSNTITFTGVVTFWDLSHQGSTTINGANITTGTISADRIAAISSTASRLTIGGSGDRSAVIFYTGGYGASISGNNSVNYPYPEDSSAPAHALEVESGDALGIVNSGTYEPFYLNVNALVINGACWGSTLPNSNLYKGRIFFKTA